MFSESYYRSIIDMLKKLLLIFSIVALTYSQYAVVSQDIGSTYVKLTLNYTGTRDFYVKPKSKVVKQLIFLFKALTYNDFSFKIYDPNLNRFQVPQGGAIFPVDRQANFSFPLSIAPYKINFTVNHFSFLITRKQTDAVIFDSSVVQIEFSDYYVQVGTVLDSKTLFGYSQRFTPKFKLQPGTWTVFNRDHGQMIDLGIAGKGKQTHGYYPAYLIREKSGLHHMGYFRTSNAMDVQIQSFSDTGYLKIYRTIGGIIDFRFIVGEQDPEELISNFHELLGRSLVPPFWSLGFHQCRWGYQNVSALENVLSKYKQNGIPLDTIWSDIDYMHEFQTFTVDTDNFPLAAMRAILKEYRYIPIVEPSIRTKGYAYEQGVNRNIFIKDAQGSDLIGKVWAGDVLFPDFFHPNSSQYWRDMLQYLYNQVPFSGVWLDMNQISNLCDGPCRPSTKQADIDYSKDIPYQPGDGNVQSATIPLNATHYGRLSQANVHVFFGLMQTYNTYEFLKNKTALPFIITRSTTFGSNRFGFHWTGDNYANFTFLRISISSNFMFGLWGINMVGSDICGFGGNTTVEVCARFFQLGSLYPFSRNHNQFDAIDQQPYALGPVVLQSAKKNLKLRYSLLKYYYRQFVIRKGLGTIFRPLYFQFYRDSNLLNDQILQTQFLIGRGLMSAPILQQNKTQRTVYFPEQIWYDYHTGQVHQPKSVGVIQNKLTDLVPLFVRDGYVIFRQNVSIVTKTDQLNTRFELVGGFKRVSSNSTHTTYVAQGGLLSLEDYNYEDDVLICHRESCDNQLMFILAINKATKEKQLQIINSFSGQSIKFEQGITEFNIYIDTEVIRYKPAQYIPIYGSGKRTLVFT